MPPQRFGPRPIDLDIIFYGRQRIETPTLQVPHPRLRERLFVLAPLADLASRAGEGSLQGDGGPLRDAAQLWQQRGGEALVGSADLLRVLPLPDGGMWRLGQRTRVMGVLNVTPDSFRCASCALLRVRHVFADARGCSSVMEEATTAAAQPPSTPRCAWWLTVPISWTSAASPRGRARCVWQRRKRLGASSLSLLRFEAASAARC